MAIVEGFTTPIAAKLAGLKFGIVDYWDRTDFIKPSIAEANRPGSRRKYSFADIISLRVARELRQNGITLQALREVVKRLEEWGAEKPPLATTWLVSDGHDVYLCQNGEELQSLLRKPGQGAFFFVVDLKRTYTEVIEAIHALEAAA